MSLVIVGSIGLDTIETPVGQVIDALGGSAVYGALAASTFTDVFIVGVVGEDFPNEHLQLIQQHNINTDGLKVEPGKTFRWKGVYHDWNHADTISTELNVFAGFAPKLPESCKSCRSLLLGNIHPDLQLQVLDQIDHYQYVAFDTMNYWITGCPEKVKKVIERVGIVFMNEDEIMQFTDSNNIFTAAQKTLAMGPHLVIVKRGEYGCVVVSRDSYYFLPAYPVENVVDPTGAGDSFAGGFMGYLTGHSELSLDVIKQATRYGTIIAALNVSSFSVDRLAVMDMNEIKTRNTELTKWTT